MPRRRVESVNCLLIPFIPQENAQPVTFEADFGGEIHPLLVFMQAGECLVYRNSCPHQGRRFDYAPGKLLCREDRLICAAHGAVFALDSGRCLQGPCQGESLVRIRAELSDDGLRVYLP